MNREVRKIAVIGSGTMGHGIAQVLAISGFEVVLIDISNEILQKALERIKWSLRKLVEKGRIKQEDMNAAITRIKTTTSYEEIKDIDVAIEAVPENIELKKKIFSKLDNVAPPHAILTSNTSTLSITEIGNVTRRPDKVAGMHFFNPPQLMPLIEVIKGEKTSQETINILIELAKKIGKTPIVVKKDVRGFIVNRILSAVFNEAFWTYYRGEASKEGIDASIKYNGGFPMGWFELADFIGLDVVYEIEKILYEAYGERFKPCAEVIEPLIKGGKLGQKTGIGFYDWTKRKPEITPDRAGEYDVERLWAVAVNEAAWLIYEGAAAPADIDVGMRLGANWPLGPCEYANKRGIDVILNKLKELYTKYKMEMYNPCPLLEEYISKEKLGEKTGRGF